MIRVTGKPDPNAPDALLGLNGTLNFPRETLSPAMDFYTEKCYTGRHKG